MTVVKQEQSFTVASELAFARRFRFILREIIASRIGLAGLVIVTIVIVLFLFAPLIAPYNPLELKLDQKLMAPTLTHPMGTDQTGRDILSRVIWGTRPSFLTGVLAVIIGILGGVTIGLVAAYYNDTSVEEVAMRGIEVLASIPLLIWAIAVIGIVGVGPMLIGSLSFPNETKIILLVGFLYIPGLARVTHAAALVEVKADYVRARRIQGASDFAIIVSDVLPNCLSPVIIQSTLLVAVGIVIEASLSFVGLGVQPPQPSWGTMLADARTYVFTGEWWLPVFPGVAISLTVIGFNLLGDALRDVLDPRRRTVGFVA